MTDEHDRNDPVLDAAWRLHSAEEPPPHLDAAILAAAHRAVKSAPQTLAAANRPWRWWAPLAAAATIGAIAVGVLQLAPREPDLASGVVSDTPVQAPSAPAPKPAVPVPAPPPAASPSSPPAEARAKAEAPRDAAASARARNSAPRAAETLADKLSQPPAAPEAFPARKDMAAQERAEPAPPSAAAAAPAAPAARELDRSQAANESGSATGRLAAPAAAGASAPLVAKKVMRDEAKAEHDADVWMARIQKLLKDGNPQEAARELNAFRTAYADADQRLPADLRDWAATVKR
jgi:Meckel syndrome type 1 protein